MSTRRPTNLKVAIIILTNNLCKEGGLAVLFSCVDVIEVLWTKDIEVFSFLSAHFLQQKSVVVGFEEADARLAPGSAEPESRKMDIVYKYHDQLFQAFYGTSCR